MTPLTIQILINNNEDTIEDTINSILPLNCHILMCDIGCTDNTIKICNSYDLNPIKGTLNKNWSNLRNNITDQSKTEWQFMIEPWEVLLKGYEEIQEVVDKNESEAAFGQLIKGEIITKPTRLWKKPKKFINYSFEKINSMGNYLDYVILSNKHEENIKEKINLWKSQNSLSIEPYYYEAYEFLKNKKFEEFMTLSKFCITNEKATISAVMMRYYQAIICLIQNDLNQGVKLLVSCLTSNILMAEFWCLLGDIFFKMQDFPKSKIFYKNAIDFGSRRLKSDRWPIQVSKYEEYPSLMISKIKE